MWVLKIYSVKRRKYAITIASILLIGGSVGLYNIHHVKTYIKRKIALAEIDKQFEHLKKISKMADKLEESFEISETDPQKALSIVKEQAKKGFPQAITLLGQYHITGAIGCEINFKKGVELIEEGLEKERQELYLPKKKGLIENTDKEYASYLELNTHNLYYLSIAYLEGDKFLLPDVSKGVMYLKKSAELGYNRACYELARTYLFGKYGVQKDISKAIAYATQAADRGNILAQSLLGVMYMDYSFGVPEDIEKSIKYLTLVSENADVKNEEEIEKCGGAKYLLARLYLDGQNGITVDRKKGLDLMHQSADIGYHEAAFFVGGLYSNGLEDLSRDYLKAEKYYNIAANNGYAIAQLVLGVSYITGSRMPKNTEKGLEFLHKAAKQNNHNAHFFLGIFYLAGNSVGVQQNIKDGIEHLKIAADNGHPEAQFRLASLYVDGVLIPQDLKKAREYLEKSAAQGYKEAQKALKNN